MSQLFEMLSFPFLACFIMGAILAYCGMHVLKREIIFIDITLAQVAAVGSIIAQLAFDAHEETLLSYAVSLGCVTALAAAYAILQTRTIRIPIESLIGVSYAIAAAAAIFLISLAPTEVHAEEMLAGTLLWIDGRDVVFAFIVLATVGLGFYLLHKPLLVMSEGHRDGVAGGIRVICGDFVFYVMIGIVITTTVRIAGVLVVFGFLIIPATISTMFSSRWGVRLVIAWAVASSSSIAGLVVAYYLDFSVGPAIALCMGLLLAIIAVFAKLLAVLGRRPTGIDRMNVPCA